MPRVCRVGEDPRREDIDRELVSGRSVPSIAKEVSLPESNIYRHRKDHLTIIRSIRVFIHCSEPVFAKFGASVAATHSLVLSSRK
jgi:hypothetical protein